MALRFSFIWWLIAALLLLLVVQGGFKALAQEKGLGFAVYKTQISFVINGEMAFDGAFTLRSGEEMSFRKSSKPDIAFELTAYNNSILDGRGGVLGDGKGVGGGDIFVFKIYRLDKNIPGTPVWKLVATPVVKAKEGEASSVRLFDDGTVIVLGLKYERLEAASFNLGVKQKAP